MGVDKDDELHSLQRESGSFTRTFGDELIAVKRPSYYAAVFVGKPAGSSALSNKLDFQKPESAGESFGGTVSERKITPYLGGGLSLFWTPAYGTSLLATNWAPTTHHGLVATELVTFSDGTKEVTAIGRIIPPHSSNSTTTS